MSLELGLIAGIDVLANRAIQPRNADLTFLLTKVRPVRQNVVNRKGIESFTRSVDAPENGSAGVSEPYVRVGREKAGHRGEGYAT
jgi:hypothetical protein